MKTVKKIIAVVMAVVTALSLGVISSSAAAVSAPEFELKVVSQDKTSAVLEFSLVNGGFNAIDVSFSVSSAVSSFKSMVTTTQFRNFSNEAKDREAQVVDSASAANRKFSIASTETITQPMPIYKITVVKKTADDLLAEDITAKVVSCVISSGTADTDVSSKVKVANVFGSIELNPESVELKYKQSIKIGIETTYSAEKITWESSNTKVATVDENGNVYASGKGTAQITATGPDGAVSDTCNVNVKYSFGQWLIIILLFGWIWYI